MQKDTYFSILRKTTLGEIRFYLKVFSLVFEVRCFELKRKRQSWMYLSTFHILGLRVSQRHEKYTFSVIEGFFPACPFHLLKWEVGIHIDYSMTSNSLKCKVKLPYTCIIQISKWILFVPFNITVWSCVTPGHFSDMGSQRQKLTSFIHSLVTFKVHLKIQVIQECKLKQPDKCPLWVCACLTVHTVHSLPALTYLLILS